jgi:hypothetical protein
VCQLRGDRGRQLRQLASEVDCANREGRPTIPTKNRG